MATGDRSQPGDERPLLAILDRSLRALGDAGQHDLACRLAAEAWAYLHHADADAAERLNRTMHYLVARAKRRPSGTARPPA